MIGTIIGAIVIGAIIGALARLVMPGRQSIGVLMTIALGIVGAFLGAMVGATVSGAIVQVVLGRSLGETDLITFFAAIPGFLIGTFIVYKIGERQGDYDVVEPESGS